MFRLLLEPLIERRLDEFKQGTPPFESAYQADLTRVRTRLKWAALIIPFVTLFYGLFDVRVGVNYWHMSPVFASVVSFLFVTVTAPLIEWIEAGSRRAMVVAARICRSYSWVFLFLAVVFLGITVTALTRVFGITYFVAELENPVLTIAQTAAFAALSAVAWQATEGSADLLKRLA